MSIGEWLDSIILQSAQPPDVDSIRPAERDYSPDDDDEFREDDVRTRRSKHADRSYDDRLGSRAGEHPGWSGGYADHQRPAAPNADQIAAVEQRLPFVRGEDRPAIHQGFAELNQRLDELTRQLGQVATMSAAKAARSDPRSEEPSRHLVEVISKLDRRFDQLIAEGRSGKTEIEQRVNAVGRAIADLNRERPVTVVDLPTPLDQALIEIDDRQRTLDGPAPVRARTVS
jgi:hypothetical protein